MTVQQSTQTRMAGMTTAIRFSMNKLLLTIPQQSSFCVHTKWLPVWPLFQPFPQLAWPTLLPFSFGPLSVFFSFLPVHFYASLSLKHS